MRAPAPEPKRSLPTRLAGWIAVAAAFSVSGPAHAAFSISLLVEAGASSYDSTVGESDVDESPRGDLVSLFDPTMGVSSSRIEQRSSRSGTAYAYGSAIANPGGVHVVAIVSASGSGSPTTTSGGDGNVDVAASSGDEFVLYTPALAIGEPLTMALSVSVSGNTLALAGADEVGSGSGNATAISEAHIGLSSGINQVSLDWVARCDHDSQMVVCTGPNVGELPGSLVVANGATVSLSIAGRARASGGAGKSSDGSAFMNGSADLGSTIAWNGIASITDSGGGPVTEYTALSSTTGYDYRFAYVPEPGAAGLAAVAGSALSFVARRRSSRGSA